MTDAHNNDKPVETFLKDYTPPSHSISKTELKFELLAEDNVLVTSRLELQPNGDTRRIELDGDPKMQLLDIRINGKEPSTNAYSRDGGKLVIEGLPNEVFVLETRVQINPKANKSLNGLYTSGGKFTTQCESEGFRNITFYLDRPDVMSEFTTTIVGDASHYPQLLSNGNEVETGKLSDGRDYVKWHDPHKKPAYLFALVAGNLDVLEDSFTTQSGRKVRLQIFVDKGDLHKTRHAMDSLKRSMRWDEERFGREYDLDRFMIVAVDDFNFGAMENKGLNIFNSSAILADPKTATDARYQYIEGVVGHEYFHNWSGNRVTLRDWFQLSLKEGFTVFRDQEFSADMNSRAVQRIEDVAMLRASQFPEDAGPMAHPIRPTSFVTIENFYTSTVYNKGAEVIRMMHTILGEEKFRKGTDLYFSRHDGQAVTTEDFVQALEDASGEDLSQFERTWYNQAGTPELFVTDSYDAKAKTYTLAIRQQTSATPGQPVKEPFHIPVKMGLLDRNGKDMLLQLAKGQEAALTNGDVLNVKQAEQSFTFVNMSEKPIPSLLREFSAPVKLHYGYSRDELTFLLSHDSDGFNRWEAAQNLGVDVIKELVAGKTTQVDNRLVEAYRHVLNDKTLDQAIASAVLTLPGETYLAELFPAGQVDVDAIYKARKAVKQGIATALEAEFLNKYRNSQSTTARPYAYNVDDIAERSIRNTALAYLMNTQSGNNYSDIAKQQLAADHNMTDVQSALSLIVNHTDESTRSKALMEFYSKWKHETLVVNQWLATQASADLPDVLKRVKTLMEHEAFDINNPNKVRSVIGAFAANRVHFHKMDGSGYAFLADQVLKIDTFNPQLAARLVGPLTSLHKYTPERRQLMRVQLERIIATEGLSKNLYEVVSKSLDMVRKQSAAA